jgi:hypothetical protein
MGSTSPSSRIPEYAPPLTCPMEGTQQQQQEWLEVGVEVVGALAQMRLEG